MPSIQAMGSVKSDEHARPPAPPPGPPLPPRHRGSNAASPFPTLCGTTCSSFACAGGRRFRRFPAAAARGQAEGARRGAGRAALGAPAASCTCGSGRCRPRTRARQGPRTPAPGPRPSPWPRGPAPPPRPPSPRPRRPARGGARQGHGTTAMEEGKPPWRPGKPPRGELSIARTAQKRRYGAYEGSRAHFISPARRAAERRAA